MKNTSVDNGNIELICDLDLSKYLGKWYEIAKLSAKAQMGLDNVTATYTLKDNGKIKVDNAGYKDDKRKGIKGSAWLRDEKCNGGLYVRFFWPFKSDYNVIKLATDYRYAVVMGESKSSLWILSRTPQMDSEDYQEIMDFLNTKGFNRKEILKTRQNKS